MMRLLLCIGINMKTFYFDVETTGLDVSKHGVVQLSGVIEVDGKIQEVFDYRVQPPKGTMVCQEALKVNGFTIEQIKTFDDYKTTWESLKKVMCKYIDQYDGMDKFWPAGYNVAFDYPFLQKMATTAGETYFGSFFNHKLIDPFQIIRWLDYNGKIRLANHKLETVCNYFEIPITNAHNALSDVQATCLLTHALNEKYFKRFSV